MLIVTFAQYEKMTRPALQSESVKMTLERKREGEPDDNTKQHELAKKQRREYAAPKPIVFFRGSNDEPKASREKSENIYDIIPKPPKPRELLSCDELVKRVRECDNLLQSYAKLQSAIIDLYETMKIKGLTPSPDEFEYQKKQTAFIITELQKARCSICEEIKRKGCSTLVRGC